MNTITEEKLKLRKLYKQIRNGIAKEDIAEKSRVIAKKLLGMKEVANAETVFLYISFGSEVDTKDLICALLSQGKRVAVPVCMDGGIMKAYEITDFGGLVPNRYGILEPNIQKSVFVPRESVDTVIVPGLAFDKSGYRLGYGGGYYDRYLDGYDGNTIGIVFSDCCADNLPRLESDKAVNTVVTEKD